MHKPFKFCTIFIPFGINFVRSIYLFHHEAGDFNSALSAFDRALTFPENLGVGRSLRTEEAMAWFWKGKTLLAMGNSKEAMKAWEAGASSFKGSEMQNSYIKLCSERQK